MIGESQGVEERKISQTPYLTWLAIRDGYYLALQFAVQQSPFTDAICVYHDKEWVARKDQLAHPKGRQVNQRQLKSFKTFLTAPTGVFDKPSVPVGNAHWSQTFADPTDRSTGIRSTPRRAS
jgi:hypothetical protein